MKSLGKMIVWQCILTILNVVLLRTLCLFVAGYLSYSHLQLLADINISNSVLEGPKSYFLLHLKNSHQFTIDPLGQIDEAETCGYRTDLMKESNINGP